jgi:hypothetical protein
LSGEQPHRPFTEKAKEGSREIESRTKNRRDECAPPYRRNVIDRREQEMRARRSEKQNAPPHRPREVIA